ncbi:MAG TPA: energy coupling factor transporter S component ThiW, partial [Clostridium sp.]|nr:energy coupling factor transporter S component ThiW [Clostridium sp.]
FMSTLAGTIMAAILLAILRRLGLFSYFEQLINE